MRLGRWLNAWASTMRSKSFYKLRISLLNEVIARMYISFLQVHLNRCIADSASEALPKNQTSLYARCVCVCIIWTDVKLLLCRGTWHTIRDHVQRSYLIVWDTEPDQLCVPAVRRFFRNSKGPSLEPQQQCYTICCTVVAIWNQIWSFTICSAASEPSSIFSPKPCRR